MTDRVQQQFPSCEDESSWVFFYTKWIGPTVQKVIIKIIVWELWFGVRVSVRVNSFRDSFSVSLRAQHYIYIHHVK